MTLFEDNLSPSLLFDQQGSDPSTPSADEWRLYFKSGGLYHISDTGAVVGPLTAGGAGLGAWTTFTPTWTSDGSAPTLGDGILTGRYKALDSKTYCINIFFQFGSTSDNGTGNYSFALPGGVTTAAYVQSLAGIVLDAGTRFYMNNGYIDASDTKVTWIVNSEAGGAGRTGETTPMTFAVGDQIILSGTIEVV